jgi:hypothetical protein
VSSLAAVYSETQEFSYRILVTIGVFLVSAAIPLYAELPSWMLPGVLVFAFLIAALVHSFMILRVSITTTTLEFGFRLFSPEISFADIEETAVVSIPIAAGIGIHYHQYTWVYNAKFGQGLKVKTSKKQYIIGSDTPEKLQAALLGTMPRKTPS